MPEIIEVELYRRAAERVVGRTVASVDARDDWFCKGATNADGLAAALVGHTVDGTRRIGKLLLLEIGEVALGLRFGMTGRLLVDDDAPIDRLEYSSDRDDPAWDRFGLTFAGGGRLVIRDPRRLGGVELDPDESRLGADAATLTTAQLEAALGRSTAPLKARLLDQSRVAGVGNLLADETLWRAGLSPCRQAGSLGADETSALAATLRSVIGELTERGGSHTGDLHEQRHRGGVCPFDGTELRREQVGGRTTYWCPEHQA